MREMGLKGAVRGKKIVTTYPDTAQPCPDDKVNRAFHADRPNLLRDSDSTYVSAWSGTVYVAFVIDVFARRIVGWRLPGPMVQLLPTPAVAVGRARRHQRGDQRQPVQGCRPSPSCALY